MRATRQSPLSWLAPIGLLLLAWWAISPGMSGGFLFDDFVNLSALGDYGGIRDARTLALYLTSGLGDPFGRPLALLSFLLDARTWPAEPLPFLRTNIILHLANGVLLILVLRGLARARGFGERHGLLAAVLGAGIWLLHPFFLSTTLYVVQREAMLATTFTLVAFLVWMTGRRRAAAGQSSAWLLLFLGAFLCTGLAALCKANGALVPLLLLAAEATVLADDRMRNNARFVRWRRWFLGLPLAALLIAVAWALPQSFESAAATRAWSPMQRLLTEPRVLLDYLRLLAFPNPLAGSVFHDDYVVSTDWLHPASTAPAIIAIIAIIAAALCLRKRAPIVAFSALFFFAGHVLESGVVPLEIYFEHRNYLPATMLFWPVAVWLTEEKSSLRLFRITLGLFLLVALAAVTHLGAGIWGQPEKLALVWAARNADSPRAQAYAAQYEMADGANARAAERLQRTLTRHPDEAQLAFNLVDAECNLGEVRTETLDLAQRSAQSDAKAAALDFRWLSGAVERAHAGACAHFDLAAVEAILHAAQANPRFAGAPGREQDFEHVQGLIDLATGKPEEALAAFDRAAAALPQPAIALEQAALLGDAGRPDLGLRHLDSYLAGHPLAPARFGLTPASLHGWLLDRYGYWRDEFAHMRHVLKPADGLGATPGAGAIM